MKTAEQDVAKDYRELADQARRIGVADLTEVCRKYAEAMRDSQATVAETHAPITFTASDKTYL